MNIRINDESFAYDIYGLTQAFFPGTKPKINQNIPTDSEDEEMEIVFSNDEISLSLNREFYGKVSIEENDRPDTKNRLKRLVYDALSKKTKKILPWGTLTGIRPTKIPYRLMEENAGEQEIRDYMKNTYLCSDEKVSLAMDIAKRERMVVGDLSNHYALYVGIPFCPSICLYCSFSSYPYGVYENRVEDYLDALIKEIRFSGEFFQTRQLDTIYIGGGTPTSLSAEQLDRLLCAVDEYLDLSFLREYTVEAGRPDSVTREKIEVLLKHRVNRISINPQTMQQKTLDLIGRFHTTEEIKKAYGLARELGRDKLLINMDLIVGLPGETGEDVSDTLRQIVELKPDNLTVHSLAVKRSSRLNQYIEDYEENLLINSDVIMEMVFEATKTMGMTPYYLYRQKQISGNLENIGFAPEGKECLYNIEIMEELFDIVALGAGSDCKKVEKSASGDTDLKKKVKRCENVKDVDAYIQRIDEMIMRKRDLYGENG